VPVYIYCSRCESRFDVTGCLDGTRLECDECGVEVEVQFENLVLMPGGIAAEVKAQPDGQRWLVCPKCGMNTDISRLSPGNRFRCRRCSLLLQVPRPSSSRSRTSLRRGDDILKCPSCRTRYDISQYSPKNRFRCRRCAAILTVPPRGAWMDTGEWEIDVEKSLIRCNRCNRSYPLDTLSGDKAFICKKCRRVFSAVKEALESAAKPVPEEEEDWEIDIETGVIICSGCKYGYDLTGITPGEDFTCKHCGRLFRMPKEVPREAGLERRERIACPQCGRAYDVSGYLRGTMFSCEACDRVLTVNGPAGTPAIPEPPAVRLRRDPEKPPPAAEAPKPAKASPLPPPDFSYDRIVDTVNRLKIDLSLSSEKEAPSEEPEPVEKADELQIGEPGPEAPPSEKEPRTSIPPAPDVTPEETPKTEPDIPAPPPEEKPPPTPPPPPKPKKKPSEKKPKKGAVRLVVRCTVCGTRHDAVGKSTGDKIQCVCGKTIRITGAKKKKKKPSVRAPKESSGRIAKKAEELLDKKAVRAEDVELIDPDASPEKS
jgi:uncharacterized protein YbaR (Trm112 family)